MTRTEGSAGPERLTMREACEALGVSRAMVRKLEAAGELKAIRERGRVLFDRAEVEALRTTRDVEKVRREQEAEEREFSIVNAEADHHELEFAAWSKNQEERRERQKLDEALGALSKELRELREGEERRQRDAAFYRRLNDRDPTTTDSGFVDLLTELAPAAAVLALAYLARGRPAHPAPEPTTGRTGNTTLGDADGAETVSVQQQSGALERELLEKIAAGTATTEDVRTLGCVLWRGFHGSRGAG